MKTIQNQVRIKPHPITIRALQFCGVLAAGLLLSGCNQQPPQVPPPPAASHKAPALTGEYALVSVNVKSVPTSVSHDGTGLQVRSGSFTFSADGSCSTKTVFVPPSGQEATREVSATYTKEGPKLTMQWKGAGTTTGTIDGNTFTMDNEGMLFVYRK